MPFFIVEMPGIELSNVSDEMESIPITDIAELLLQQYVIISGTYYCYLLSFYVFYLINVNFDNRNHLLTFLSKKIYTELCLACYWFYRR